MTTNDLSFCARTQRLAAIVDEEHVVEVELPGNQSVQFDNQLSRAFTGDSVLRSAYVGESATFVGTRAGQVLKLKDGEVIDTMNYGDTEVTVLHEEPVEDLLILGDASGKISLINQSTLERRVTVQGHDERITALVLDPNQSVLYSGSTDGVIRIWEVDGEGIAARLGIRSPDGAVRRMRFLPASRQLAVVSQSGIARIWDIDRLLDLN